MNKKNLISLEARINMLQKQEHKMLSKIESERRKAKFLVDMQSEKKKRTKEHELAQKFRE